MTVVATVKNPQDTTGQNFPAPALVSAQREILLDLLSEKIYWLNPESIVKYTEADFARADEEFGRVEAQMKDDIKSRYREEEQKEAMEALIPTHPWKRMEKINGKSLKQAFPYLFE
eukprot:CAMPEP_0198737270 /NCGR_PEP_ID=MMETSP1475-20131203/67779_1 /TAXON_ID= ORGANISM="Unidentified sp., Strain CCMP1999" /NCGR_SAMPLE_ID=MMETSP1475 /ASSEMBLY_ACC=CAM_ASM_001111 /LENGTH=115 /DNA_ID=CAMNT_0044501129 /DNA_START=199 /DNA_END=546 /DNA_ORIENTATION=-